MINLYLNSNLATKARKDWILLYNSGDITWTGYTTITVPNFGLYSEVLFITQWYSNPHFTITLPVSAFKLRNSSSKIVYMTTANGNVIAAYYVSDTQIAVYDSAGTHDRLEIYVR